MLKLSGNGILLWFNKLDKLYLLKENWKFSLRSNHHCNTASKSLKNVFKDMNVLPWKSHTNFRKFASNLLHPAAFIISLPAADIIASYLNPQNVTSRSVTNGSSSWCRRWEWPTGAFPWRLPRKTTTILCHQIKWRTPTTTFPFICCHVPQIFKRYILFFRSNFYSLRWLAG